MREKPTIATIIYFINYAWYLLHVSALYCHLQVEFIVPSERCSIGEQSIEYPHPQYSIDSSSIDHLSEGTRKAP
jgi:hypothetical protein